jgi:transcriptional regulator of nitric oxide reductase
MRLELISDILIEGTPSFRELAFEYLEDHAESLLLIAIAAKKFADTHNDETLAQEGRALVKLIETFEDGK